MIAEIEENITIPNTIDLNRFSFIDFIILIAIKNGMIIAGNNFISNTTSSLIPSLARELLSKNNII